MRYHKKRNISVKKIKKYQINQSGWFTEGDQISLRMKSGDTMNCIFETIHYETESCILIVQYNHETQTISLSQISHINNSAILNSFDENIISEKSLLGISMDNHYFIYENTDCQVITNSTTFSGRLHSIITDDNGFLSSIVLMLQNNKQLLIDSCIIKSIL